MAMDFPKSGGLIRLYASNKFIYLFIYKSRFVLVLIYFFSIGRPMVGITCGRERREKRMEKGQHILGI